jgi:capsular exopolysaccharide synthesis family protein
MAVDVKKTNEAEIDLVELLGKVLHLVRKYYYIFLAGIVLALGFAYLYIKKAEPVYEVYTSLLVEEEENKGLSYNSSMDMVSTGMASFLPGNSNVDNQVFILKSYDHLLNTVMKLDMDVSYYKKGFFGKQLFTDIPFEVVLNKKVPQLAHVQFNVKIIDDRKFELVVKCDRGYLLDYNSLRKTKIVRDYEYVGVHGFGDDVDTECFSLKLKKKKYKGSVKKFSFVMNNPHVMAKSLTSKLTVSRAFKQGGIVTVKLKTKSPEKGIKVLQTFTDVYLQQNIDRKNAAVNKMIEFVESQFDNIASSLKLSEDELQSYQANKDVVDLSAQGQLIIQQLSALEDEKSKVRAKLKYLNGLKKNILTNNDDSNIVAPSIMGIEDMVINSLVNKINELNVEKTALCTGLNNSEMSPQVVSIKAKLLELEKTLLKNIDNIIDQIKIFSNDINKRITKNKSMVKELPSKQMGLVNIKRGYEINSELYSQLLEKKLNYYIMKASNIINKSVVEEARLKQEAPIWPRKKIIFLVALFLGTAIPMGILVLIKLFDNKIKSKKDLDELTDYTFLGRIPFVHDESKVIVDDITSPFSESYRNVRFRIDCLAVRGKSHKISVTSSFPGEGKTITSINIANSFAMLKKKTVLIGCDMRKPQIGNYMGINGDVGLSSYLIGYSSMEDVIKKTKNEYLDVILCGLQPPNPSELIASDKFEKLVEVLGEKYDYIIFDTPPIGLVVDALVLARYVDYNVYVARSGITHKKQFVDTISQFDLSYKEKMGVMLNGVDGNEEGYYGGYYGGYKSYRGYGGYNSYGAYGSYKSKGTYSYN